MWRAGWGQVSESGTNSRRSADVWKISQGSKARKRISERENRIVADESCYKLTCVPQPHIITSQ